MSKVDWLRLWHDTPNDPKWRTIARVSGQRIGDVIAVYIHMLVNASTATERGRTHNWNDEDVASALDIEPDHVQAIRSAMQGRVLDGDRLTGWEIRQPKREDNSADRSKAWREQNKRTNTHGNESERTRTQPNATQRLDKEKSREDKKEDSPLTPQAIRMPFVDIPNEWKTEAMTEMGWPENVTNDIWSNFREYWQNGKGKNTKRSEWSASWRTWYRKEKLNTGGQHGRQSKPTTIDIIKDGIALARAQREQRSPEQAR